SCTGTSADSSFGFPSLLTSNLGIGVANYGISGSTVGAAGLHPMVSRTSTLTNLTPQPSTVFVLGGYNDAIQNGITENIGDAVTSGTFVYDYAVMMQALVSGMPNTVFYCIGILPTTSAVKGGTTLAQWNAGVKAAIAAVSPNTNIIYIDTVSWINPTTGVDTIDGVHPNPQGYLKVTAGLMARIFPPRRQQPMRTLAERLKG
ncbi:MAG TPA: SGNH/GDSL hydrolase family protein, partial [Candidatus Saccharimonadales bacterium]|nr:SGNH/GDSL hydrolase family protein [Candidatus Saccharimonadales bacterium]